MIKLRGLQQRLAFYMFLPVAILLVGMGSIGFIYAKNSLLTQWGEAATLKLQRAAHTVDMRLGRTKEWLKIFHMTSDRMHADFIHQLVIEQLSGVEGVARVNVTWKEPSMPLEIAKRGVIPYREISLLDIMPPRYDSLIENDTVSLVSDLKTETGRVVGQLEVVLRFDYLMDTILASGWLQSYQTYLVDNTGKILSSAIPEDRQQFGDSNHLLELKTMDAMKEQPYGTVIGQGVSNTEVSGFYKLKEAPWTLIMVAHGSEILSSVLRFRMYYFVTGTVFIFIILLLLRLVMGRTVFSIKALSNAAKKVAKGEFVTLTTQKPKDEVDDLVYSFNTMVAQLEERTQLKNAMDLAMEVQQNLLPQKPLQTDKLDIAGKSIYCDETGGDYFDFFQFPELGSGNIGIAVGDVVGHGISAALLMTTVRAFLRSSMVRSGSLEQKVRDVNRLVCLDTTYSCDYMTLFLLQIDSGRKELRWVRAGHDPAIIYDPASDTFNELNGRGTAIGIDETFTFQENTLSEWSDGQIIVIGTDGIWETENLKAEKFGRHRLRQIIRENSQYSSQAILQAIIEGLAVFRDSAPQEDDVTLVVVKAKH